MPLGTDSPSSRSSPAGTRGAVGALRLLLRLLSADPLALGAVLAAVVAVPSGVAVLVAAFPAADIVFSVKPYVLAQRQQAANSVLSPKTEVLA